jgi:hypothetical protein
MGTTALVKVRDSTRAHVPSRRCAAQDKDYNAYLDGLDPRGESEDSRAIRLALASSPDPRFREFVTRLNTYRYSRSRLATVAKSVDISLAEFNRWGQHAAYQRALAEAQQAAPRIIRYLAAKALPHEEGCDRCDGLKWVPVDPDIDPAFVPGGVRVMTVLVPVEGKKKLQPVERNVRACPACGGTGLKVKPGDLDAAKLVVEIAGLTGKKASVQINNNFGGAGLESRMADLRKIPFAVDVEAETVEERIFGVGEEVSGTCSQPDSLVSTHRRY